MTVHFTSELDCLVEGVSEVFTNSETSLLGMFHNENMSSINLFQARGLKGLAVSSRFSRSAIKITEKATAILVPIATP